MIYFETREYRLEHDFKEPRGRGHWMFETETGFVYSAYGTYTEAKKKVYAESKAAGYIGALYVKP